MSGNRSAMLLALVRAARPDVHRIRQLLTTGDVDSNCADELGFTPLMVASANGHEHVVQLLLSYHALVDQANWVGDRPLTVACALGHASVVKQLLAAGGSLNVVNAQGETPLIIASVCGDEGTVRALLQAKAAVDLVSKGGDTAICAAGVEGNESVVSLLLACKAMVGSTTLARVTHVTKFANSSTERETAKTILNLLEASRAQRAEEELLAMLDAEDMRKGRRRKQTRSKRRSKPKGAAHNPRDRKNHQQLPADARQHHFHHHHYHHHHVHLHHYAQDPLSASASHNAKVVPLSPPALPDPLPAAQLAKPSPPLAPPRAGLSPQPLAPPRAGLRPQPLTPPGLNNPTPPLAPLGVPPPARASSSSIARARGAHQAGERGAHQAAACRRSPPATPKQPVEDVVHSEGKLEGVLRPAGPVLPPALPSAPLPAPLHVEAADAPRAMKGKDEGGCGELLEGHARMMRPPSSGIKKTKHADAEERENQEKRVERKYDGAADEERENQEKRVQCKHDGAADAQERQNQEQRVAHKAEGSGMYCAPLVEDEEGKLELRRQRGRRAGDGCPSQPREPLRPNMDLSKVSLEELTVLLRDVDLLRARLLQELTVRKRAEEEKACTVCMDGPLEVAFVPCGHLVCCAKCASLCEDCPACRSHVQTTIKIFTG